MLDPTYPLFPIAAFLGFILVLIPLPWHLQAWNSGTCYYMIWVALACLNQFVNSVVWARDAINHAPIWCDISIRITMGASVALPAASLCINRRLYRIASGRAVAISHSEKRRAILVDTLICVALPMFNIALQYIILGHRFNIYENIGCYPAQYNTLLTYFLSGVWPIVIGTISATYCVMTLRSFARRRIEFSQFLSSNKSSLTMSRYFRLMGLAMADIIFTTPPAIYLMYLNATASPIEPWRSWADTHYNYSRVGQIPAVIWHSNRLAVIAIEFSRWLNPVCALVFFCFFGLADEARKNYRAAFWWVVKHFGWHPRPIEAKASLVQSIGHFKPKRSDPSLPPYSPPSSSFTHSDLDTKHIDSSEASTAYTNDDVPTPTSAYNKPEYLSSFSNYHSHSLPSEESNHSRIPNFVSTDSIV